MSQDLVLGSKRILPVAKTAGGASFFVAQATGTGIGHRSEAAGLAFGRAGYCPCPSTALLPEGGVIFLLLF